MHRVVHVLILAVISVGINGQSYFSDGLQRYYGQPEVIKPVQEESDDNPELARYYRAEQGAAQASLQFQPVQYDFQSPAFTQQHLQPQSFYQQQQLLPQTLFQAQPQPQQPQLQQQQLRSLQGFADPAFQQDYKYRMIYAAQVNPTPPPPPAQVTPGQQAPPQFQFQPDQSQFTQPQPFALPQPFAQPQQFAPQPQQFAQPQPFAPQPQQFSPQQFAPQQQAAPQSSQLGVSYSPAGVGVSKTTFSSSGASYSF